MGFYEFQKPDAYRFADSQHAETRTRDTELQFKFCPYCHGGNHRDQYTFSINLSSGTFNCRRASCYAHGNMITLSRDFDFSLGKDVDAYYNGGRRFRRIHRKEKPLPTDTAIRYLTGRGIAPEVVTEYNITSQTKNPDVIVFPFYDENDILTFAKYRNINFTKNKPGSKEWCERDCKPILFGMNHCSTETSKTLVMTEGQIDSLSCTTAGIPNAVSVPTGKKGFTWVPYCWDFMGQFETLVVFGDHENGEITLLSEMAKRFQGAVKYVRPEDYRECKDANELLQKHGAEAVRAAVENAAMVEDPRILRLAEVEQKDLSTLERASTGFRRLDGLLGGFYFGQLAILTGERGNGKSTLGNQFGIMAMRAGYPVMFYSGELEGWFFKDWIDRQCAGPKYIITSTEESGFESEHVKDDAERRITEWYRDLAYLYNNHIIEDVDAENETMLKTVETSIKQYGCRFIILDNLMTAMNDDVTSDLYRQQSNFVRSLAEMATRFNVFILLIAHPKKTFGNVGRNDDISGSGNITNLADVVMAYTMPEPEKGKEPDPTQRVLKVLKNRLNGQVTQDGIPLYFERHSKRIAQAGTSSAGLPIAPDFNWEVGWEPKENAPEGEFDSDGFRDVSSLDDDIPF